MKGPIIAALAFASAFTHAPAYAGFLDGNTLYTRCTEQGARHQTFCLAYVMGVLDVVEIVDHETVCLPDGTSGQLRDVVVQYLRNNPKERHNSAVVLIKWAMVEAYTCSK